MASCSSATYQSVKTAPSNLHLLCSEVVGVGRFGGISKDKGVLISLISGAWRIRTFGHSLPYTILALTWYYPRMIFMAGVFAKMMV